MSVKVKLANKAELDALPEALRGVYKEAAGGAYTLDADVEDTSGLKSALESERTAKKDLERQLRDTVEKFKGLDPQQARQALKALADPTGENLPESIRKQIDALVESRNERLRADHETQVKALQSQIGDATKERDGLTGKLGELLIDNALRAACIEAGVIDTAIEDVVLAGRQLYRIKDGAPVPMQGDQILYGKDPTKPMPPSEWVTGKTKDKPHWFKGSGGGGATTAGTAAGGHADDTISEADARDPRKYRDAATAARTRGASLRIV